VFIQLKEKLMLCFLLIFFIEDLKLFITFQFQSLQKIKKKLFKKGDIYFGTDFKRESMMKDKPLASNRSNVLSNFWREGRDHERRKVIERLFPEKL